MRPKEYDGATQAWFNELANIVNTGEEESPRGMLTKEVLNNTFSFPMDNPIVYHQHRKLSYKFLAAEALWIISGDNSVRGIAQYNKHISQFSDNGEIFNGAYGPPFQEQVPYVVRSLEKDHSTRQAVMTIWNRRPETSKDIPCTVALSWNVRNEKLNCHVFMRSSDIWLGLPYDMFNFSMMSLFILDKLETMKHWLKPGNVYMNLVSSHLYGKQYLDSEKVLSVPNNKIPARLPEEYHKDWKKIGRSIKICRDLEENSTWDFWRIRPI